MRFNIPLAITSLAATVSAYSCTDGLAWTPEEFAEYLTLDDTTGWAPMERIKHCQLDESDVLTDIPAVEVPHGTLKARSGGNRFVAYSADNCPTNNAIISVNNFGCGGCYSVPSGIKSGYLWRQYNGNPYPTVDFYSGEGCSGSKIHHQGIESGRSDSCNNVNTARSFVVYQGC
ncbi:hypothetical protein QIS74_01562 [Colletotrichum tabaci]|uniref:Secreted protein n=2 Tax=Colletotrichum destructivum species complex TaxID=2707350 RepID=A0A4T0VYB4_9PEZI|nr:hypothetical protein CH35J_007516 [Colletotrichum higginsianum]